MRQEVERGLGAGTLEAQPDGDAAQGPSGVEESVGVGGVAHGLPLGGILLVVEGERRVREAV